MSEKQRKSVCLFTLLLLTTFASSIHAGSKNEKVGNDSHLNESILQCLYRVKEDLNAGLPAGGDTIDCIKRTVVNNASCLDCIKEAVEILFRGIGLGASTPDCLTKNDMLKIRSTLALSNDPIISQLENEELLEAYLETLRLSVAHAPTVPSALSDILCTVTLTFDLLFPLPSQFETIINNIENVTNNITTVTQNLDELSFTICEKIEGAIASLGFTICDKVGDFIIDKLAFTVCDKVENAQASLGYTICDKAQNITGCLEEIKDFLDVDGPDGDLPDMLAAVKATICDKSERVTASLAFTICEKIENAVASIGYTVCDKVADSQVTICEKIENAVASIGYTVCDKVENAQASILTTLCDKIDNLDLAVTLSGDIILTGTILVDLAPVVASICDKIENAQASLSFTICDKIGVCRPTPLFPPNDPTDTVTISEPGSYCLTDDFLKQGGGEAIEICASQVVLDLSSHQIAAPNGNGINIKDGECNIIIKNGFIIGNPPNNPNICSGDKGIHIEVVGNKDTSKNIQLCDLTLRGWNTGLKFCEVDKLLIKDTIICIADFCAAEISDGCNIDICNSTFNQSLNECGLSLVRLQHVRVKDSRFNKNKKNGVMVDECECVEFRNCSAGGLKDGTSLGAGFFVCDADLGNSICSENILFKDCFACCYKQGFKAQDAKCLCMFNCVAKDNIANGFEIVVASGNPCNASALIKECHASCNGSFGFKDDGDSDSSQYYSNTACNNGTNYDVATVLSAPITSPQNARGVDNIDCNLNDDDQVDTIQLLLQSLVDNLL